MIKPIAVISFSVAIAGCGLLQPIHPDQSGRIAEQHLEARDAELNTLSEHNQDIRRDLDGAVMTTPARAGSGLVGEVDVGKALSPNQGKQGPGKGKASTVTLEFSDANLKDIITVFMQDYLKQPYTFQDSFKDRKVNLFFNAKATREDLVQLFDTLLENYGVRLRYSGGVYLVGSSDDKANPMQQPSPLGIGDAVGVFRVEFLDARDFLSLARQVAKYPDKITGLPGNVIVVNSTSTDVRSVRSLMDDVDVPAFSGKYVLVYNPRYLSATSLAAMLDSTQNQLVGAQSAGKQFEAKQIPDSDRLIIVAANKSARDLILQLLAQSDVAGADHRRVFQYILGTQAAADVVVNLTTLTKSVIKSAAEVTVVADKVSNSLFIYASPEEYAEIRKLLARLDFRPPEVQVEIAIAEVNLNDSMRYGVEWYLKKSGSLVLDATAAMGGVVNPNLAIGLVDASNNYATLQLLASQTTFSLLSNPKIVVKNGATAKIAVGQEEPVIKQKTINSASAGNNTVVEPEFKKIGLELEVTPFVTATNEVRMIIKLKDTSIVGTKKLATDDYPVLANRELNTEFVTSDGRTVFLGGIRKQSATDTSDKVPGLGDVPGMVGALFRSKDMQSYGSELIILATPTVLLDQQGADLITRALLRAARQEFKDLRPPQPKSQADRDAQAAADPAPGSATP